MKREKKLTKRERKAASGGPTGGARTQGEQHIHCVACGRHLDGQEFEDPPTATVVSCKHGSSFPSCVACVANTTVLLAEHDRTGQPVKTANAYH